MGLPQIIINFMQKAASAITRSEKGVVCLLLDDTTTSSELKDLYTYEFAAQVDKTHWTEDNVKIIKETLSAGPSKVYVVRVASPKSFDDVKATVDSLSFNWLAYTSSSAQSNIVEYVQARNGKSKGKKVKAVVFNATAPDDEHIVNFANTKVKRKTDSAEIAGNFYVGRLAGLLAALPFTRSSTYYVLNDLEYVTEPEDVDAAIDAGKFVIINDFGEPKIGRGVNSLTTVGDGKTDDWKSIVIIEAIDLILEDIYTTFKNEYVGKYKNKYDYQCIFLSAVNRYFEALEKEDVLDNEYDNHAEIDVEAQRTAWLNVGKEEAASWDELTVKKNSFKKQMFLAGNIKILDAMEDMTFNIDIA